MQRVKKIVLWTLLAFVAYAIVKSPTQAADIARSLWGIVVEGLINIGRFFNSLLNTK